MPGFDFEKDTSDNEELIESNIDSKYLVGVTFTEINDVVFDWVHNKIKPNDYVMFLHCVVTKQAVYPHHLAAAERAYDEAVLKLNTLVTRLKEEGFHHVTSSVERGEPKEVIMKIIKEQSIDTLVIGHNVYTAVNRFFYQSFSSYMIENAPCVYLYKTNIKHLIEYPLFDIKKKEIEEREDDELEKQMAQGSGKPVYLRRKSSFKDLTHIDLLQ